MYTQFRKIVTGFRHAVTNSSLPPHSRTYQEIAAILVTSAKYMRAPVWNFV
jgi:hypothetical protein